MATTTPNFGWVVPTSTDLVKDGATAIETLGDSIDASLLDLKGGTTGQVLKKNSNTDMDFVWSADAAGMTNPMTTTGDTIYSSSGSTPARLGIGTTGQVLTVAGGVPTWATAGAGFVGVKVFQSADQSLSNATFTAITFNSETFDTDGFHSTSVNTSRLTVPSGKAGYYLVTAQLAYNGNATGQRQAEVTVNAAGGFAKFIQLNAGSSYVPQPKGVTILNLAVGDYVELNGYQDSGGALTNYSGVGQTFLAMQYLGA
jgi:hypothetical protein